MAKMNADSIEVAGLEAQSLMLVRLAALVAVDAPPASYLLNLGAADEVGVDVELVQGVFAAVAPIVGTPRVASAVGKVVRAPSSNDLAGEHEALGGTRGHGHE